MRAAQRLSFRPAHLPGGISANSIAAARRYPATAPPPHAATQAGRSGRAGRPGSAAAPRPKRGRRDQHGRAARPAEPARQRNSAQLHQRTIRRRKSGAKWPILSGWWYHENNVLATFYKTFVLGAWGAAPLSKPPPRGGAPRRGAGTAARPREGGHKPPQRAERSAANGSGSA